MTAPTEVQGASVVAIASGVGPRPDVDELELAMGRVRERPDLVLDLLRSALQPCDLAEITARSYWHPNGFAKIVLHEAGPDGTSVRLHVWPAVADTSPDALAARRDSAPHGHRWNFASALVAGSGLLVEEFEVVHLDDDAAVDPGDVVWDELVFEPSFTAVPRRRGKARLLSREYWVRDPVRDIYWCDVTDVHTIGPIDGGMTATLVLQGSEVRTCAPVFRRPDGPPDPGRRTLDESSVVSLIDSVIRAMVSSCSPDAHEDDRPCLEASTIRVGPTPAELRTLERPSL